MPSCGCGILPANVFDASPTTGNTCNIGNAAAPDGKVAGLDYQTTQGVIDGQYVEGCVGADFGSTMSLDPVDIRAESVSNACGGACCCGYCGTGDSMYVFSGTSIGSYTYLATVNITSSLADYTVNLGHAARYVVVCRTGNGQARDDVAVDSITACK